MSELKCVYDEQQRLLSLFQLDGLDDTKRTLVTELINEAAFMKSELILLKEQIKRNGSIQISLHGKQRQSEPAKYYTKLVAAFSSTLKTIATIIGNANANEDDELDMFLKSL